jgi:hypothetical protein
MPNRHRKAWGWKDKWDNDNYMMRNGEKAQLDLAVFHSIAADPLYGDGYEAMCCIAREPMVVKSACR